MLGNMVRHWRCEGLEYAMAGLKQTKEHRQAAANEEVKSATSRQEALLKELKAVEDEHAAAQCVRQPKATLAEEQEESTELRNAIRNLAKEGHFEQAHNNARREKE